MDMEEQMNALAHSPLFWGALIAGLLVLYVLPSVIGAIRKVEGLGWLIVINLIPTGVGWLAAMVMAFALPRREARALYQPVYYYPQPPGQRW
jgi:hypothetical protein